MPIVTALAISIGLLGGLATYLFLGPLAATNIQIWAVFLAWACFYHVGGKEGGLAKTMVHNVFGIVVAWVALLAVTHIPLAATLGLPLWAGICVGASIVVAIMCANLPAFSVIPAWVYGYATIAAYALLKEGALGALTAPDLTNPLIVSVLSMVTGAVFAYVSEKLAGVMVVTPATAKA